jgi:hypothetical protein
MKRTALTLAIILVLSLAALAGIPVVNLAGANPIYTKPTYVRISVQSPQNTTYNTQPIFLNFTVETNEGDFNAYPYFYLLDGQDGKSSVKVEDIQLVSQKRISDDISPYHDIERRTILWDPYTDYTLRGQAVLPNLSDGDHNVTVFIDFLGNQTIEMDFFASVPFTIHNTSQSESQEPFPTVPVAIASVAMVAIIGLGLLVYFKKKG